MVGTAPYQYSPHIKNAVRTLLFKLTKNHIDLADTDGVAVGFRNDGISF